MYRARRTSSCAGAIEAIKRVVPLVAMLCVRTVPSAFRGHSVFCYGAERQNQRNGTTGSKNTGCQVLLVIYSNDCRSRYCSLYHSTRCYTSVAALHQGKQDTANQG